MRTLKRGESDYQATVSMIALKHGTVAGEGGIIHVDPNHSEARHRRPLVSEADAGLLEKRKLARRATAEDSKSTSKGGRKAKQDELSADGAADDAGARTADVGAERVADTAGAEDRTGGAASNLSTRETTTHQDAAEVRGEGDPATGLDAADPTVPPVPGRGGRQAAPAKTGN